MCTLQIKTALVSLRKSCSICALMLAMEVCFLANAYSQVGVVNPLSFSNSLAQCCADSNGMPVFSNEECIVRPGTLTSFFGIDGSKQPQDFGANANLGVAGRLGYAGPLIAEHGIGFQIGTRVGFAANAVQVYELLGESKDRFQNFTTVGIFQRTPNGFAYGLAYDYLTQDSFDNFSLGQWRFRASYNLSPVNELGLTLNFSDRKDIGRFNAIPVELEPVEQLHIYLRHNWQSGVNTSVWIGVADKHSEENVLTGTLPNKTNQILAGAEIFAPLNEWMAIYGETNLIMPADTGAVDAYLGIEIAPYGIRRSRSRQNAFRSLLPVASNATFTTDLTRR